MRLDGTARQAGCAREKFDLYDGTGQEGEAAFSSLCTVLRHRARQRGRLVHSHGEANLAAAIEIAIWVSYKSINDYEESEFVKQLLPSSTLLGTQLFEILINKANARSRLVGGHHAEKMLPSWCFPINRNGRVSPDENYDEQEHKSRKRSQDEGPPAIGSLPFFVFSPFPLLETRTTRLQSRL